ncbi:MAG TPA: hypothetical protein VF669_18985 [Tepidisphaeraceae bacterium]
MRSLLASILLIMLIGCASHSGATTKPSNTRQRQDAALHDPFKYKPDMGEADISGGDVGHLDRGGMRRDVDHVFNP